MKRVFIAIDISDDARRAATAQVETLRRGFPNLRVSWERPEKLHLTLKFLGDVSESLLEQVSEAVKIIAADQPSFEMKLAGTGVFPEKGAPRILWVGIDPAAGAERLAREIENGCAGLGFERERRKFSPHLTMARLRDPAASTYLAKLHRDSNVVSAAFTVDQIIIYESQLQPSGSIYSKLAGFPLRGRSPKI